MGSSPLTRGKRLSKEQRPGRPGAHPRSRGENRIVVIAESLTAGSSPLTRGKRRPIHPPHQSPGLIPAHAGKTASSSAWRICAWAHPRSRGENFWGGHMSGASAGSSPLTRGKRTSPDTRSGDPRLIPAHAGKTRNGFRRVQHHAAHPRSRGENDVSVPLIHVATGSSPLTRGKHFLTCAFIAQIGQILESLELCASSESYSSPEAYATDALQGRVRSIDLGLRSSRGAS